MKRCGVIEVGGREARDGADCYDAGLVGINQGWLERNMKCAVV